MTMMIDDHDDHDVDDGDDDFDGDGDNDDDYYDDTCTAAHCKCS